MSFNNNNKSGSASVAGSAKGASALAPVKGYMSTSAPASAKGSQKGSHANSPSRFLQQPLCSAFQSRKQSPYRTSPAPSNIFMNKKFVKKASSSHPSGAESSGPMGQFTTKRAEIVAAQTAFFTQDPVTQCQQEALASAIQAQAALSLRLLVGDGTAESPYRRILMK